MEEILAEEQAGFRPGRSIVEEIFNIILLIEKHLKYQCHPYHNFIDIRKAFGQVWHEGLWQVKGNYSIDDYIIQVIEALYKDMTSTVLLNSTEKIKIL